MITQMQIIPAGDSAMTVSVKNAGQLAAKLSAADLDWLIDWQLAFGKLTLFYNPLLISFEDACRAIDTVSDKIKSRSSEKPEKKLIVIPVRYGGPDSPDLARVTKYTKLSIEQIIQLHTSIEYEVAAVGFMPGFGYLTGLPQQLQIPRIDSPRLRVPAGSVAIGGPYTGIYPFASPGGWNLIGRTSLTLFDPKSERKSLLQPGMRVRFANEMK